MSLEHGAILLLFICVMPIIGCRFVARFCTLLRAGHCELLPIRFSSGALFAVMVVERVLSLVCQADLIQTHYALCHVARWSIALESWNVIVVIELLPPLHLNEVFGREHRAFITVCDDVSICGFVSVPESHRCQVFLHFDD